jgi:ketosteroid isomerase-like protein
VLTERSEFVAAARALDEAFVRHTNAGELDQLVAAYYTSDAQVLPPNVPAVQGRGQIRELFREMLDAGVSDVTRETLTVYEAGDRGYGIGIYTYAICRPGRGPVRDTGKYLHVYCRQADGAWMVAVEMFSSNLPAR